MRYEFQHFFPNRVSDLDVNVGRRAEHVAEECEQRPARPQEN